MSGPTELTQKEWDAVLKARETAKYDALESQLWAEQRELEADLMSLDEDDKKLLVVDNIDLCTKEELISILRATRRTLFKMDHRFNVDESYGAGPIGYLEVPDFYAPDLVARQHKTEEMRIQVKDMRRQLSKERK